MAKCDWVEVKCSCGHVLGRFRTEDDHGGVSMECPACKGEYYVANQLIMFAEDED